MQKTKFITRVVVCCLAQDFVGDGAVEIEVRFMNWVDLFEPLSVQFML